jgi:hypothetical protein
MTPAQLDEGKPKPMTPQPPAQDAELIARIEKEAQLQDSGLHGGDTAGLLQDAADRLAALTAERDEAIAHGMHHAGQRESAERKLAQAMRVVEADDGYFRHIDHGAATASAMMRQTRNTARAALADMDKG